MDFNDAEPYINKLKAFQTSREIAKFLIGEGIKAEQRRNMSCALAEYIHEGSGTYVSVSYENICSSSVRLDSTNPRSRQCYLEDDGTLSWVESEVLAVPTVAMKKFIADFDLGEYPELIG